MLLTLGGVTSCSVNRFIPEGESLYTGSDIEMTSEEKTKDLKDVENELNALLGVQPNSKTLGMYLGLYYHYKAQNEKPGLITKWLNKKIGEEPIYLSDTNPERVKELLLNRLDNRGFFYSKVQSSIDSVKNSKSITYDITLTEPYLLENFELQKDSLPIYVEIQELMAETEIKRGNRFDLNVMKFERERIDRELKQRGYYNFNPDFLIFEADTNRYDNRKFDLVLRLKKQTPKKSIVPYEIDSITVYPNYSIENDSTDLRDGVTENGIHFIQKNDYFRPDRLEPYILFGKGQKYNAETARLTSNRLSAIGSYKFVNIRFNEKDSLNTSNGTAALDADIYLSQLTKRSVRAELQAVTKSNGFAGPGISLTYSNRNLFRGGETLSLSGNFAYATQISGGANAGLSTLSAGLKADLILPRLVPFSPSRLRYVVPKTKISLGGDLLDRGKLYTLNSVNASYGYTWNANEYVFHELNPISVNYVNLLNSTEAFEAILDQNPFLRQSFEQQFIAGLTYSFTYNELVDKDKTHPIYVAASLDVAGNTLNLLNGGKETAFGLEYAQYAKLDLDFRFYLKWGKEQALITRLYGGWGIPYGNSSTLPFVKQFFSGGPYSVRAFQIRSLGPGSFSSTDDVGSSSFFDQSGNLRLEANLEYRFPIWSYLKGAVFADAGNVWLTNEIELSPNESEESRAFNEELSEKGRFGSDWASELGVGVGLGLRVDVQSFVIRLDVASPWRVPYLPDSERSRVPFFDGGSNNLTFNFAIGYPF